MNARSNSVLEQRWNANVPLSSQVLRQWSAPGIVLAVTDFAAEEILLFHAIQQARRSTAKVLLVHVLQPETAPPHIGEWIHPSRHQNLAETALAALSRMARQLRWVGVPCEPLLLRGSPAKEIALVAEARNADRILMTAACEKRRKNTASTTLTEDLLPGILAPICTVGQWLPTAPVVGHRPANITLALSLDTDAEMPLAFASRLAQEHQAKLTVLHVFSSEEKGLKEVERTPLAVASQLPADRLREAELMCPLEIAVRKGDPATEILKAESRSNQDFIVLGPVGEAQPLRVGTSNIAHRVISEALCPVIVLGRRLGHSAMG
ncbi:MAG TPA: universal stress protein [Terracidiphilus sp.]|nr:universal stress protein [Terracidiphilus sp.]